MMESRTGQILQRISSGVDERIIRALAQPDVLEKPRMRSIDLGYLHTAILRDDIRFAISLVDSSGRASARSVFDALGWVPGQTLHCSVGRGYGVVYPMQPGLTVLDPRYRLLVPPVLLRRCGIASGDNILLVGAIDHQLLIVHPMFNLAQMVRTFHNGLSPREVKRTVVHLDDRR